MAASPATGPAPGGAQRSRQLSAEHESFLRHRRFRWLKLASALCLVAIGAYLLVDVQPRPNGGSWLGYTLGTLGAGLIVWLALLGVRKRAMTRGAWSLKAWTSAHVYLGLSLIVIATLHSGFQFGWNVHTLAYALMILVIASGVWGVSVYAALPGALSANREGMTSEQMIEGIRAVDRQLHDAAQPLGHEQASLVLDALNADLFAGGLAARLTGTWRGCATERAIAAIGQAATGDAPADKVEKLLIRRKAQLDRLRRQLRLRALLEVWLYVHVPATIALLAALTAHIVSVFYYW
ncbi:MAG: hypothetical protein KGL54_13205 [Sphingomonadales bacterium]|nr:hypothetical protein [Sphingomonadales bacterium]